MPDQSRTAERLIAQIADRAHRLSVGALIREYPGVYRAGLRGEFRRFTWDDVFEDQSYMRREMRKLFG